MRDPHSRYSQSITSEKQPPSQAELIAAAFDADERNDGQLADERRKPSALRVGIFIAMPDPCEPMYRQYISGPRGHRQNASLSTAQASENLPHVDVGIAEVSFRQRPRMPDA